MMMYGGIGNNFYSSASRPVKTAKQRVIVAIIVFFIMYSIIIVRLADIMIFNQSNANQDINMSVPSVISRADIIDRNGIVVATSLPTVSLYACPHEILSIDEAVEKISAVFKDTDKKIRKLKEARPDLIISTEVIVGFPGETEVEFQNLVKYLNNGYFSDIGVASYEPVLGTKAAMLPNQVPSEQKAQRMKFIKENFLATCYPADESSAESVIEEYIKAYEVLTSLPKNILKDRQQYNCIAGTDTRAKLEELEEYLGDVFEKISNSRTDFDLRKNHKYIYEKYTPEARKFFFEVISRGDFKQALKLRARTLLLEDYSQ